MTHDLQELLTILEEAVAVEAKAKSNYERAQVATKEANEAVAAAVEEGATTGDAVRDYVMQSASPGEYDRYAALNAAVEGKVGELLIGMFKEEVCTRHTFDGRGNEYETVYGFICSTLTGEPLQFSEINGRRKCLLPLRQWSQPMLRRGGTPPKLISDPLYEGIHLGQRAIIGPITLVEPTTERCHQEHHLWVVAGDGVVRQWISNFTDEYGIANAAWRLLQKRKLNDLTKHLTDLQMEVLGSWAGRLTLESPPESEAVDAAE